MKVLVTGGAGYIGSHVSNFLRRDGHDVVVLDNLSTGNREALLGGRLVEMDLNQTKELNNLFEVEKFDAVMHFAGSIVVPESVDKPIKYYKNNTENSLNLINCCIRNGVDKLIFSSTAALYGILESGIADETTELKPINPYGTSKLMTEMMLKDVALAHDNFNYVALRYFNVAGASIEGKIGQSFPNATHLIKVAVQAALGKRDGMSIFGEDYDTPDGTCIRDYIHVEDLAQAHLDALKYLDTEKKSNVFNCGYGHGYSVLEVLDSVKRVTGVDINLTRAERRAGDAPSLISKNEKIKSVLGWSPKHDDLDLIVKTAYEWEKRV